VGGGEDMPRAQEDRASEPLSVEDRWEVPVQGL
jgi:hypothetical protein